MENIIALGTSASELASKFDDFPQYKKVIKIKDTEISVNKIEDYEEVDISKVLKKTSIFKPEDSILFILFGENPICAAALRILETIKDCKITILYRRPKIKELSNNLIKAERLFYNVLQEYARSGVFENIILFDLEDLEDSCENINLLNYNSKINEAICFTVHNLNSFEHQTPVKENYIEQPNISRIQTLGLFQLENLEELWYFPLDNVDYLRYHIVLSKNALESDLKLLKKINDFVDLRSSKFGENIVKYLVHEGSEDTNYGIMLAASSAIQK